MPQGERERKVKHFSLGPPRGIPKGTALGAPLVTFPATGKSPGCRAERLQVGAGTTSPAKAPGCRAERPHRWVQGLPSRKSPRRKRWEIQKGGTEWFLPFVVSGLVSRVLL